MSDTMANTEYNGWKNYATWSLFSWLGSMDPDIYNHFAQIAKVEGEDRLQLRIAQEIGKFREGSSNVYGFSTIKGVVSDWLGSSVRWVSWNKVYDLIADEKNHTDLDTLTYNAYQAMPLSWEHIVEGAELRVDKDTALESWFKEQVITWYETQAARKYTTSPISIYCRLTLNHYLNAVDWHKLYETLVDED